MANPAITGKQQSSKVMMRMLWYREHSHPVSGIPTAQIAPRGNWNRMLSKDENPKVDTISGPNPETAPLTVYLVSSVNIS